MDKLVRGNLVGEASDSQVILNGVLQMTPGEIGAVTALIATAVRMLGLPALPEHIDNSPFRISFTEEGTCKLSRSNSPGEVDFEFEDSDDLIILLNDLIEMARDAQRLRPSPRGTGFEPRMRGDIIEGGG